MSEPKYGGCTRLAEILGELSHDSVNRFLLRERYEPKDLFNEIKPYINIVGGVLSVDDTVADKPYSNPDKAELIGYFWSGKHHQVFKGINIVTLYYRDLEGKSVPINYRVYDKKEGKTKNNYFREMFEEVISWGLKPKLVTGDSWYASLDNLKFLRKKEVGFLFGISKDRTVSNQPHQYNQVQNLEIPESGLLTHLKGFGFVKLFRTVFKKEDDRHYILYLPEPKELNLTTYQDFLKFHDSHWGIENYHRATKQVCSLERFLVRDSEAIKTHIFCSIRAFVQLELMRIENLINNWYEVQRNLFKKAIREYILENRAEVVRANADDCLPVNA
jgi:hypothetical protein